MRRSRKVVPAGEFEDITETPGTHADRFGCHTARSRRPGTPCPRERTRHPPAATALRYQFTVLTVGQLGDKSFRHFRQDHRCLRMTAQSSGRRGESAKTARDQTDFANGVVIRLRVWSSTHRNRLANLAMAHAVRRYAPPTGLRQRSAVSPDEVNPDRPAMLHRAGSWLGRGGRPDSGGCREDRR